MKNKGILKDNRGISFTIVLFVILVLSTLSLGLLNILDVGMKNAGTDEKRQESYYTAEGCVRRLACELDKLAAGIATEMVDGLPEGQNPDADMMSPDFFERLTNEMNDHSDSSPIKLLEAGLSEELGMPVVFEVSKKKVVGNTATYAISAICTYDGTNSRKVTADYVIPLNLTWEFETTYEVDSQTVIVSSNQIINNGTIYGNYSGEVTGVATPIGTQKQAPTAVPSLVIAEAPSSEFDPNSVRITPPVLNTADFTNFSSAQWSSLINDETVIDVTKSLSTEYLLVDYYFLGSGNGSFMLDVTKPVYVDDPRDSEDEKRKKQSISFSMDRLMLNNTLTINVNDNSADENYPFYLYVDNFAVIEDGQELIINNGTHDVYVIINELFFASTARLGIIEIPIEAMDITINGTGTVYFFVDKFHELKKHDYIKNPDSFVTYFLYNGTSYANFPMTITINAGDAPVWVVEGFKTRAYKHVGMQNRYASEGFSNLDIIYNGDKKLTYFLFGSVTFNTDFNFTANGKGDIDFVIADTLNMNADLNFNIQDQKVRVIIEAENVKDSLFTNGYDININEQVKSGYGRNAEYYDQGCVSFYLLGYSAFAGRSSTNKSHINCTESMLNDYLTVEAPYSTAKKNYFAKIDQTPEPPDLAGVINEYELRKEEYKIAKETMMDQSKHFDMYYYPESSEQYQLFLTNYVIAGDIYVCYNNVIIRNCEWFGNIYTTADNNGNQYWPEVNISEGTHVVADLIYAPSGNVTVFDSSTVTSNIISEEICVTEQAELTFAEVTAITIPCAPVLKMNDGSDYTKKTVSYFREE